MSKVISRPTNPLFGPSTATGKVFANRLKRANSTRIGKSSAFFMQKFWKLYNQGQTQNAVNGYVFETLLAILLEQQNLVPLYHQAHIAFVPNVRFDLVLYSEEFGPIVLSAKTSLRERYKQVDLEGWVLRQVHRQAKTYLITVDEKYSSTVNKKIARGEVMAIERVVYALGQDMDDLIFELRQLNLKKPGTADIMTAKTIL